MTKSNLPDKKPETVKSLFAREDVRAKFEEMLGKKAQNFIVSVLQIVNSNALLASADPMSIYNAAALAATLDLPLNNNLGFAYIIPYNQKYQDEKGVWQKKSVAQFQISAKGFNQLAQRSGQFQTINATDVREGEITFTDRLSGEMQFNWMQSEAERNAKPVVGYVSYFKLINGFEKPFYMSVEKLKAHGKKYSKTWGQKGSKWEDDFDAMCLKTVIKLNLSKNAPLSIEMQKAITLDQAVINDDKGHEGQYIDNTQDVDYSDVTDKKELMRSNENKGEEMP
jgi:recombination protein RecT